MAEWETREIRELKVGRYVNIDDEPCKIISIDTSKPGKHGSAKANIVATSIFTGAKKSLVGPVSTKCQVPVIDKRKGQVLYTQDNEISILDIAPTVCDVMGIEAPAQWEGKSVLKRGGKEQ